MGNKTDHIQTHMNINFVWSVVVKIAIDPELGRSTAAVVAVAVAVVVVVAVVSAAALAVAFPVAVAAAARVLLDN